MNANALINMVVRQIVNRLMRAGINKGVNSLGKTNSSGNPGTANQQRQQSNQIQRGMKSLRRFTRF